MGKNQEAQKKNIQAMYQSKVAEVSQITQSEMHRIMKFKDSMEHEPKRVYNAVAKVQELIKELNELGMSTAIMNSLYQVYLSLEGYVEGVQIFLVDVGSVKDDA